MGEPARWLHRGMTSSDVLDTSFAILLTRAADLLIERLDELDEKLARRAREHAKTPLIGRSHGIHAEPTTFGVALAGHFAELRRGRLRLARARDEIAVGKIAGAVGTYAHLTPEVEEQALTKLGLARRNRRHAGRRARSSRRVLLRARARRGGHRAARHQRAALAAHRGRRGRRALRAGAKGLERDAAQAKPRAQREPLRSRARRARGGGPGARERRALARARHLAFVGRAHDRSRRDGDARLHARAGGGSRGRPRRLSRAAQAEPRALGRPLFQRRR